MGDPYNNLGADEAVANYLGIDPDDFYAEAAVSEIAQAHGRSRSPQRKRTSGGRLHLHYGRLVPFGWDAQNCLLDQHYGGLDAGQGLD